MGLDLSGNAWKPDSEKMGSTDTGDYFPEVRIPGTASDRCECGLLTPRFVSCVDFRTMMHRSSLVMV
jgi:hypothetical protein